jgi:large subunit ribosomal protein L25
MIKDITINASAREGVGKGPTRRLRAKGMIPAAIYGEGGDALAIAVSAKEIATILRSGSGHNTIFKLALPQSDGEPANVIIKDYQIDPIKGRLLHADLLRLSMTTTTRVSVSVETIGEPPGVKTDGGILELQLREIEAECLPGDIPEHLTVDVSHLQIGDHVTVADLVYDREKVKLLVDEHQIVAGVLAPRMVEEVAPAVAVVEGEPGAVAAEPEVIKKGKTDEE